MRRKRWRKMVLAVWLLAAVCALWGCGGKDMEETVTELGVDGYVYLPEKIATTYRGLYTLPNGFDRPIKAAGSLFFREMVTGGYAVRKGTLNLEEKKVLLDGKEAVFAISGDGILLKDAAQTSGEEEIFSLLDDAVETGMAIAERGAVKSLTVDPEACYGRFYLLDYAVDEEQNVYLILQYNEGNYFTMDQRGYLVCKMSAAGEWGWRLFFS
ncbi:MAG: hypothetical protein HDR26_01400 [Lachnospiraceae bacterium]|nr:hypothetical protein [Lachnospiraceae bacterium]